MHMWEHKHTEFRKRYGVTPLQRWVLRAVYASQPIKFNRLYVALGKEREWLKRTCVRLRKRGLMEYAECGGLCLTMRGREIAECEWD